MSERFYWKARLAKGTPYIPIVTWFGPPYIGGEELDRSPRFQALVRNETTARAILFGDMTPIEVEGIQLRNLEKIDEAEWRFLTDHAKWATARAPHLPDASPRTPIDRRGRSIW